MATVLYAGWNGGYVGGWIAEVYESLIGSLSYALPVLFVAVGGLMVARSTLVDLRPFRIGLFVLALGLLFVLGRANGGYAGRGLESLFSKLVGNAGVTLLGATAIADRRPPALRRVDRSAPARLLGRGQARRIGRAAPDRVARVRADARSRRAGDPCRPLCASFRPWTSHATIPTWSGARPRRPALRRS